jgi:hypothetical protein
MLTLFFLNSYSQRTLDIKYLDKETIDQVKIDYDKDGDLDIIVAGVFVKKNQGRVYLIKNNGIAYKKPEHIFSFPSIGTKQNIELVQDGNTTKIIMTGTSPTGKKDKFTATLNKGEFEGLLIPPVSSGTPQ